MGTAPAARPPALRRAGLAAPGKKGADADDLFRIGDWDQRYEGLRTAWLAGCRTGGCALVRRQGLLAWMHAEAHWVPPAPVRSVPLAAATTPPAVADELVLALVELLANRLQGELS